MITILLVCVAVVAVIIAIGYVIGFILVFGITALLKAITDWASKL